MSTADAVSGSPPDEQAPDGPRLSSTSAASEQTGWSHHLWLWPAVSGSGALEVELDWPEHGITTSREIAVDEVAEARDDVVQPWQDEPAGDDAG